MYRERIFVNNFTKTNFEKSRDLTAKCIPYLKQMLGGEFVHTEQFNRQSFAVTLDVDYGIDLLWVKDGKAYTVGVRTSDKYYPYFTISCDNYNGTPAEYNEIKTSFLAPIYIFKITFENEQPLKLYIAKADELVEYIDLYRPKKHDAPRSGHYYYSIPITNYKSKKTYYGKTAYFFREYNFADYELKG
jgi:hypothetical protein